jgi:hypothetical protein
MCYTLYMLHALVVRGPLASTICVLGMLVGFQSRGMNE